MNADRFQIVSSALAPVQQLVAAPAFVPCPAALQNWTGSVCPWEQVYRMAYEQARAALRPSIVERLQANLSN